MEMECDEMPEYERQDPAKLKRLRRREESNGECNPGGTMVNEEAIRIAREANRIRAIRASTDLGAKME